MRGFSIETQRDIAQAQNFYCRVKGCLRPIHSIHHRLPNTAVNRKLYPNFINSPMCGVGLCFSHHSGPEKEQFRVMEKEAQVYESWLNKLKK